MTAPDTVGAALVQALAPDQYAAYEDRIADRVTAPDTAAVLRFAAALADTARVADIPPAAYRVEADDPTVYVHVHQGFGAFEQWRYALGIPAADVELHTAPDVAYMRCQTTAPGGVTVQVTGYSSPLPGVDR